MQPTLRKQRRRASPEASAASCLLPGMAWADPDAGTRQAEARPKTHVGTKVKVEHPVGPGGRYDASIPTGDGSLLTAEVWRAEYSRRVIVFVHGFCGERAENGLFHALARECSAHGFNAVLYDWRGLGSSDGDFTATSLDDHVTDFQHVLRWAGDLFGGGTDSISAVGFSLGAAVIGSALRNGSALSSIAYLSPAARPNLSMWPRYNTPQIAEQLARQGVAAKPGSSVLLGRRILDSLRTTDLGPSAFDVSAPLLVCHGTNDTRIDCSHSRKLADARRKGSDENFSYREIPGASHSFRPDAEHWRHLASIVASWFAQAGAPHMGASNTQLR